MTGTDGRSRITRRWWLALVLVTAGTALGAARVGAEEIKVQSAGAVRAIVTELSEAFRQETGNTVALSFGTVGVSRGKLAGGDPMDVVIMTDVAVDEAIREGRVVAGTRTDLARTGMGVAVREGAPRPDISTPEALKASLLAARSLVYVDPARARPAASTSRACWSASASRTRYGPRRSWWRAAIPPRRSRAVRRRWWCTRSARSYR